MVRSVLLTVFFGTGYMVRSVLLTVFFGTGYMVRSVLLTVFFGTGYMVRSMLLYVHKDRIWDGEPRMATSTFPQLKEHRQLTFTQLLSSVTRSRY